MAYNVAAGIAAIHICFYPHPRARTEISSNGNGWTRYDFMSHMFPRNIRGQYKWRLRSAGEFFPASERERMRENLFLLLPLPGKAKLFLPFLFQYLLLYEWGKRKKREKHAVDSHDVATGGTCQTL